MLFNPGESFCDAIHKWLTSNQSDIRIRTSGLNQMLGAPKANLKPQLFAVGDFQMCWAESKFRKQI